MRDGGATAAPAARTDGDEAIIVIFIAPRRTFVFRDAAAHRQECERWSASHRRALKRPISLFLRLLLRLSRDPSAG